MKILITGAAGFLGSYTANLFHSEGYELRLTDQTIQTVSGELPVRPVIYSLLDREACYRLCEDMDVLIHLGNIASPSPRNPQSVFNANVQTNMNMFQAAEDCGVKEIIFSSSIQAVAGSAQATQERRKSPPYLPMDQNWPLRPANTYALSKAVGEQQLQYAQDGGRLRASTAIRFPYLRASDGTHWWSAFYFSRPGSQAPSEAFVWLPIEDAAKLMLAIVKAQLSGFRIYQPGARIGGNDKSAQEIIGEFYKDLPLRKPLEEIDSLVDNSLIERETGWTPSA